MSEVRGEDVEEIETRLLLEAIYARYGYDLRRYSESSMRRRVQAALSKSRLGSLGELQHAVLTDPSTFASVLDDLTIRVTELFRDPSFYLTFRERVVPHLRTYPLLRLWHAGCASGEEVYATAIVLREVGLYDRAQLYATDLNPAALQHAKTGVYEARHLAAFSENYRRAGGSCDFADYHSAAYDRVAMIEPLRRNVFFFEHDLVSDQAFGEMQVVFCRNVLIYFDEQLKRSVIRKFAQSLRRGGFLCLGRGEALDSAGFGEGFVDFDPEQRIYRYDGATK